MNLFRKLFGNKEKSAAHQIHQFEGESACKNQQELLERYGTIALEKQNTLGNIVEDLSWETDLEKGTIQFAGKATFPMQVLGTLSHSSGTWMWAWANAKSDIPQNLLQQSLILKQYGEDNAIDILTNPEFAADDRDLHVIGMIASGMFNNSGYYLADYGRGIMCVTIKSEDIDLDYHNSHLDALSTFPRMISLYDINHRRALICYLKQKGYQITENGAQLTAARNDETITASFDDLNRLSQLNG